MRRVAVGMLLLSLLVVAGGPGATPARAHGGTYAPPPPPEPPPPPPPVPPTTTDPRIPGPQPRPTPPPGPITRGDPVPTGPTIPGGATTPNPRPRPKGAPASPATDWRVWWGMNCDDILRLKARIRSRRAGWSPPTPTEGKAAPKGREERIRARFAEKVLPALRSVVADPRMDPDLRAAAVVALAKGGDARDVRLLMGLTDSAKRDDALVEESAVLGLGILGLKGEAIRDRLLRVLGDRSRRWRTRCFAALSLGLVRDDSELTWQGLTACLDGGERVRDVEISALVAIGLVADPARVPELVRWLERGRIGTRRLDDLGRSHVVSALGRIGDPAALPVIRRALDDHGLFTRRSAVIAYGQIVPGLEDRAAPVRDLRKAVDAEHDAMTRNFGLIALGRIAGAPGTTAEVAKVVTGDLLDRLAKGAALERPFAALALGLAAFDDETGPGEHETVAAGLRAALDSGDGDLGLKTALPLALGMIRDRAATERLLALLGDAGKDPGLRASAALGLGLIGAPAGRRPVLERLLTERDPGLRVKCATAAALLGGREALPLLLEVLSDPGSGDYVAGSTALALGAFGDPDAIEPLLAVLEAGKPKGKRSDQTRAMAAVALGQIGSRRDVRTVFRIAKDLNYSAIYSAIGEVVTIL